MFDLAIVENTTQNLAGNYTVYATTQFRSVLLGFSW